MKRKLLNGGVSPDVGKATQFKVGQIGNPAGAPRKLETVISKAMQREAGTVAPDGNTYAARIAHNALIALDKGLEAAAESGKVDRTLVVMYELYTDRLEGKPIQPVKDLTDSVETRSDEELRYWLQHKHWPDEPCGCVVPVAAKNDSVTVQ